MPNSDGCTRGGRHVGGRRAGGWRAVDEPQSDYLTGTTFPLPTLPLFSSSCTTEVGFSALTRTTNHRSAAAAEQPSTVVQHSLKSFPGLAALAEYRAHRLIVS